MLKRFWRWLYCWWWDICPKHNVEKVCCAYNYRPGGFHMDGVNRPYCQLCEREKEEQRELDAEKDRQRRKARAEKART